MRREDEFLLDDFIDLTPMINVSLVLVIVFLCISPMSIVSGIKALESKKDGISIGKVTKNEMIRISLDRSGNITIDNKKIDKRKIVAHIKDAIFLSKIKDVLIVADDSNRVQDVVFLMDIAKQSGASKVYLE